MNTVPCHRRGFRRRNESVAVETESHFDIVKVKAPGVQAKNGGVRTVCALCVWTIHSVGAIIRHSGPALIVLDEERTAVELPVRRPKGPIPKIKFTRNHTIWTIEIVSEEGGGQRGMNP